MSLTDYFDPSTYDYVPRRTYWGSWSASIRNTYSNTPFGRSCLILTYSGAKNQVEHAKTLLIIQNQIAHWPFMITHSSLFLPIIRSLNINRLCYVAFSLRLSIGVISRKPLIRIIVMISQCPLPLQTGFWLSLLMSALPYSFTSLIVWPRRRFLCGLLYYSVAEFNVGLSIRGCISSLWTIKHYFIGSSVAPNMPVIGSLRWWIFPLRPHFVGRQHWPRQF